MGKYLGYIEVRSSFYNFRPLAEINDASINVLTDADRQKLLPKSNLMNINLYYRFNDELECKECSQYFKDKHLMIFEFDVSDFEENYTNTGALNQTGYKINYKKVLNTKLRSINSENRYRVVSSQHTSSPTLTDRYVIIPAGDYIVGDEILVQMENHCYAGPFKVGYRDYDNAYLINPKVKENNYVLSLIKPQYVFPEEVFNARDTYDFYSDNRSSEEIVRLSTSVNREEIDVITDELLIEYFKNCIDSSIVQNGKISIEDIENTINDYDASLNNLSPELHSKRLNRIKDILIAQKNVSEVLSVISGDLAKLFINNAENPDVDKVLQQVFYENPEMLNGLESTRLVQAKLSRIEEEINSLENTKDVLNQEIDEAKTSLDYEQKRAEELKQRDTELYEKMAELDAVLQKMNLVNDISILEERKAKLSVDAEALLRQKAEISKEVNSVEARFTERMESVHSKMYDIAFDGFLSNEMLKASSVWEADKTDIHFQTLVSSLNEIETQRISSDSLANYIYNAVRISRPQYNYNTVMNIMICIMQNLITVFSGEPGCGKTSICKIIGRSLGLCSMTNAASTYGFSADEINRFITLSVERGWTSKRDFIGYYNPLTKKFDLSNKRMYEALRILSLEKERNIHNYPFIILLDEANLSPMEYYWADFMSICDDLDGDSSINLGENYTFGIPETLRFIATMNSDHTTETLSPRLVDRAWIITLPKVSMDVPSNTKISEDLIRIIPWEDLKRTFGVKPKCDVFSSDIQMIYDTVLDYSKKLHINISSRTNNAIRNYWSRANELMCQETDEISVGVIAIDYAIAQKVLPKLQGSGEFYETILSDFKGFCDENGLLLTARILTEIIERGNQQMRYYQFF